MMQFKLLKESLVRKDAPLIVLPEELSDDDVGMNDNEELIPEGNGHVNEEIVSSEPFTKGFDSMLEWMKFHTCLSCIQPQLDMAIQKGGTKEESVVIANENIVAFE